MTHVFQNNPRFTFAVPLWVEETTSTNDLIKKMVTEDNASAGLIVAARRQTRGKGRMGNSWITTPDRDLAFSFLWEGRVEPSDAGTLPMACALGIRDFLSLPELGVESWCKWPNDVLTKRGKICGILTETQLAEKGVSKLIVGIGINLAANAERNTSMERETDSVEEATGFVHDPKRLLPKLLPRLRARIGEWERGGFHSLRNDFIACLWGIGEKTSARLGKEIVNGIVQDVNHRGELLLLKEDGNTLAVASAAALDVLNP